MRFRAETFSLASWCLNRIRPIPDVVVDENGITIEGSHPMVIPWRSVAAVDRYGGYLRFPSEVVVPALLLMDVSRVVLGALADYAGGDSYRLLSEYFDTYGKGERLPVESRRAQRIIRRFRVPQLALLAVLAIALTFVILLDGWMVDRDRNAARQELAYVQLFAARSRLDAFVDLTATADALARQRVSAARASCGWLDVFDVGVSIVSDPGDGRPVSVKVKGRDGNGRTGECLLDAYWLSWCEGRLKLTCRDVGGAWVRSPANLWSESEIDALRQSPS
jgi:hypothetical protein